MWFRCDVCTLFIFCHAAWKLFPFAYILLCCCSVVYHHWVSWEGIFRSQAGLERVAVFPHSWYCRVSRYWNISLFSFFFPFIWNDWRSFKSVTQMSVLVNKRFTSIIKHIVLTVQSWKRKLVISVSLVNWMHKWFIFF